MILILSDLFKALWFMVYGIAALLPGTIQSASTFCQVSGFFTASGIELSGERDCLSLLPPELTIIDFSVLMIAIHNALYIFNPPAAIGEGGLYPYRYFAYALLVALPLLMAGLAFINRDGAYLSGGASCQLPVRPFWYRLALSWIPRYLIFLTILGIDTAIYIYIKYKFAGLANAPKSSRERIRSHDSTKRRGERQQQRRASRRFSLPPTPPLAYNGLIPETRTTSEVSQEGQDNSKSNQPQDWPTKIGGGPSMLKWTRLHIPFQAPMAASWPKRPISTQINNTDIVVTTDSALETPLVKSSPDLLTPISGISSSTLTSWTTFVAQFSSRPASKIDALSFLRSHEHNGSDPCTASVPFSQLELMNSRGENLNELYLMETRNKIRKQLRFLFIYPVAYMAMWILPFASHALQYNDYYAANPPFILNALVTIIMTAQSAVDCWIFNVKEKPWRLAAKNNGGQWFLCNLKSERRPLNRFHSSGGKCTAAMAAEATFAYRRRDEEIAARASEMSDVGSSERRERSWWDELEDSDEGLSPLVGSVELPVDGQAGGTSGPQANKTGGRCNVM